MSKSYVGMWLYWLFGHLGKFVRKKCIKKSYGLFFFLISVTVESPINSLADPNYARGCSTNMVGINRVIHPSPQLTLRIRNT